jgi:2-dehydro-3-deoxygluconokinase
MNQNPPRLVAVGECMIELRQVDGANMRQSFGGDTLNTALYLARLAGDAYRVSYATAIGGDDPYSKEMVAGWNAEGIDTSFVTRRAGEMPGLYTIHVDASGERYFSYWRQNAPARQYFSLPDCPLESRLDEVDVLYLSGISLAILPPEGRQRLFGLMARLRERGGRVVFDNNYRARLWKSADEAREAYAAAYAQASIALITLNDEQDVLGGVDEAQALARIRSYGCAETVIKRGSQPTLLLLADGSTAEVAATRVAKVVDTTAAGDSFAAGYLAARLRGLDVREAAKAGNTLAGTVIQHPGAIIPQQAMPVGLFGA